MNVIIDAGPSKETQGVFQAIVKYVNEVAENQYDHYCLQTALDAFQTEYNLLQEFESDMQQYSSLLRENVKVKWTKLMEKAKKNKLGYIKCPQWHLLYYLMVLVVLIVSPCI